MGGFKDNELVGTAPDASYYLFITEDGANEWPLELSLWVEAAEEADRLGADRLHHVEIRAGAEKLRRGAAEKYGSQ
jgi:hypothetical protein